jgi:uncharacterized membrane protein YphA (DoxX/SURF4 family)
MPSARLVRSFVALWWTLGALLFYWSIETVRRSIEAGHAGDVHALLLGGIEAVAALLFLIPVTLRVGAAGLLFTFAAAFALHAAHHQLRLDLALFAAAVVFVAVHGPVPLAWLAGGPREA